MRLAASVLVAALLWAPAAAATEVDAATLRDLAGRAAAGDEAARDALTGIETVDGRPVDVAGLLEGAGADEAARLRALAAAADGDGSAPGPADARRQAEEILSAARFGGSELAPGRSLTERIFELIEDFAAWLLPSAVGDSPGWVLAGLVVIAVALVLAVRAVRRLPARRRRPPAGAASAGGADDPDELSRAADAAGAAGDYAGEVRLRFRAGLLYLHRRELLPFDPAMTTGRLARTLPGPAVRDVATSFDAIVYGGRPATAADARAARERWSEILAVPS